VTKKIKKRN